MDYETLLKRGMNRVPDKELKSERWEAPVMKVLRSGSRSIMTNFSEVAKALRREEAHLQKFILKELATKGELKGGRLDVQGVFTEEQVNRKLELYVKSFVTCPECKKHDTNLKKERGFFFIKCEVCGAREPVGKV